MNILHYSRRVAQGMLLLCTLLVAASQTKAQCTLDPLPAYAPVPSIVLAVDAAPPGGGDVDLNNNIVASYFFSDCNISPLGVVRIYDDPVLTNPGFPQTSITYTCASIGVVVNRSYWVTVAPIGFPGQASPRRELKVTVIDNLPPVIACPVNFAGNTNPSNACSLNIAAGIGLTTATDNCTNPPNVTWNSIGATINAGVTTANGSTFNKGVTTVTYTATDASLNTATCSFTITITDNDPPVPTCPANQGKLTDPGVCTYTYLNTDPVATAVDNCDMPPVISYALTGATTSGPHGSLTGVVFNRGLTTVTVTVGTLPFTATCPFTVTVSDPEDPTIGAVPSNQTIGTSTGVSTPMNLCDGTYTWTHPTVGDNCSVASQTVAFSGATTLAAAAFTPGNSAGAVNFNLGLTTITYLVTDNTGNTTSKIFTVTVQDNEAATNITEVDQFFSVPVDPLNCSKDITWTRPSIGAPSDCGSVTMTETFVSGPNPNVLTGLPAFNTLTGGGVVNTNFPAGTTVIRYTWVDNSAASTPDFSVLYTFTVTEMVLPTATCVPGVSISLDPDGDATLMSSSVGIAADNCPLGLTDSISMTGAAFSFGKTLTYTCTQLGANTVYFKATDAFGNTQTCATTVTVLDNLAPSVLCPAAVTASITTMDLNVCFKTIGTQGNLTLDGNGILVAGEYDDNCTVTQVTWSANNGASPSSSAPVGLNTNLSAVQFQKGLTTVSYNLTDASGNVNFCNFTVNVVDFQPPVAVACPANITVNANQQPGCNFKLGGTPPPGWTWNGPISFTNNCAPTSFIPAGQPSNLQTFPLGPNLITINGVDAAGNVGTCSFTITVQDNTDPIPVCATPLVRSLNGSGTVTVPAADFNGGSTDNCYLDLLYEVRRGANPFGTSVSFTCSDIGMQPVSFRVSEDGGVKSAITTCMIEIKDASAPTITCPGILNVELAANGLETLTTGDVTGDVAYSFSDNCAAAAATVGISDNPAGPFVASIPVDCSDVDVIAPTTASFQGYFRVTDGNGNNQTCIIDIYVLDVTAPSLAISNANVTVQCNALPAAYEPVFVTNDACDATLTPTQVGGDVVIPGLCEGAQTIIKTFEVKDASENISNQVTQTITFIDNTAPTITVPSNITINLSTTGGNCFPMDSYNATFADNCSSAATLLANGGWSILYADGLTESDDPMTNLDNNVATSFIGFSTGVNTVTYTTEDDCGNPVIKSFTVTVIDNVLPSFTQYTQPLPIQSNPAIPGYCGANFTVNNAANNCGASFEWLRPYAGPVFPIGPGFVFPDIEDCNQLTVTESIVTTLPTPPGGTQVQIPTIAYNAFNPLNGLVPTSLFLPVGVTTFTYTANDGQGNIQPCTFTVQVRDNQTPIINCPANVTLNTVCPTQTVSNFTSLVNISDNCLNNVVLTQSKQGLQLNNLAGIAYLPTPLITAADPTDGSEFNIVFTAVDGGNNAAVPCTTKVTLNDADAPIPTVVSLPNLIWNCGFAIVNTPTAGPNCGIGPNLFGTPGGVSATPFTTDGSGNITQYKVNGLGSFFITWSYNDGNGNISTQLQQLTIFADTGLPSATCSFQSVASPLNIILDNTGNATITPAMIGTGADPDNCGSVTTSLSKTTYSCQDLALTTVTFTATDVAGNTKSCTANIKVIDNLAPVFNANPPANETVECGSSPATAVILSVTDNCKGTFQVSAQEILQPNANFCDNLVDIVRTWIATDNSGNQTVKTQGIIVKDTQAPVWTNGSAATITVNSAAVNPSCDQVVTLVMTQDSVKDGCSQLSNLVITKSISGPGNTPNCPILPGIQPGQCASGTYKVGTHTITFTATDPCGNVSTHVVTLIVKDIAPPVASCVNGISITLNPNGQAIVTPNLLNNNSFDNCNNGFVTFQVQQLEAPNGDTIGNPSNSIVFDCDEADEDESYPIVLWVTDAAGNKSFCETYVTVQDNVTPTITCPPSKNIDCTLSIAPNVNNNGTATAVDNCQQNVAIVFSDFPANNGFTCQTVARTWIATDSSGNSSSCIQNFVIKDDKPPVFTFKPASDTISCSDPLINEIPVVADNCSPVDSIVVVLTEVSTKTATGCGKYSYNTTRTWKATDECGNFSTYTQTLMVYDSLPPQLLAPHVITVQSANFPQSTSCTAPVVLNPGLANSFSDCSTLSESTINAIQFIPALANPITPNQLDVSGNYPVGTTKVVFKITDACGNQLIDTFFVTVIDNSTPIAICNNNVVVALGNNGQATIDVNDIDLNSSDNCGIATRVLSQSTFDCSDLGLVPVTMTVTDIYGNVNSCSVSVNVTAGANTGFTLNTSSSATSYFGATNGAVAASPTGGSNNFTYLWSTTATTATVQGLAAGTYTVTVTDQFTGCQQTATVTVDEGPKVKITVGAGSGMQNAIVKVPVFVDNFINVSGFSFSIDLNNLAVGSIVSPIAITNQNPALAGIFQGNSATGTDAGVIFVSGTGNNVTLPNGAKLFDLCIQLSGAPLGTSSTLTIDGSPVQVLVQRVVNANLVTIPADLVAGTVQITAGLNDYDIEGLVKIYGTSPQKFLGDVTVSITGNGNPLAPQPNPTNAAGEYERLNIPANVNTVTSCAKAITPNSAGLTVNVQDLLRVITHIFAGLTANSPLNDPINYFASDVNQDGKVDISDLALIQNYINGAANPAFGQWRFVRESAVFPPLPASTNAVYGASFGTFSTISHTPLVQDQLTDNFWAFRFGDANSISTQFTSDDVSSRTDSELKLMVDEQEVTAGQVIEIPFKAKDFIGFNGYQFTLGFDPNQLELEDIQVGTLPNVSTDLNFGTGYLAEGYLTSSWVNIDPVVMNDDAVLFTLKFRALTDVNALAETFNVNSNVTAAMGLLEDGTMTPVTLGFNPAQTTGSTDIKTEPFVLYQNQPNPFNGITTIGFRLPKAERATLNVYNVGGQLVRTVVGNFEKGYNTVQMKKEDLGGNGVYYYELATPSFSDRKKMILID